MQTKLKICLLANKKYFIGKLRFFFLKIPHDVFNSERTISWWLDIMFTHISSSILKNAIILFFVNTEVISWHPVHEMHEITKGQIKFPWLDSLVKLVGEWTVIFYHNNFGMDTMMP